jgi:hypothetical protein
MVGTAGTSKWNKIEHRLFGHIMESCPEFPENYAFRLTRKRYYRAVNLDDPPDLSHLGLWIVGTFHTHPHRDEPGGPSRPGDKGIGGQDRTSPRLPSRTRGW